MSERFKGILFFCIVVIVSCSAVFVSMNDKNRNTEKLIIGVHIKGEVNAPGYYELKYGSRLKDVVQYAGGETEKADLGAINLAIKLSDGEEITIPAKSKDEKDDSEGKININKADEYTLSKLDGIGNKIAQEIIKYRAKNGSFKSIEQIKKVNKIGNSKFQKIKDKITV